MERGDYHHQAFAFPVSYGDKNVDQARPINSRIFAGLWQATIPDRLQVMMMVIGDM